MLGGEEVRFEHLQHLNLDQVLKEALRLWPTAPAVAVYPYEKETILGGRYLVRQDQSLVVVLTLLHRDPKVWGPDAEEFNPDHFAFERAQTLSPIPGSRSATVSGPASDARLRCRRPRSCWR